VALALVEKAGFTALALVGRRAEKLEETRTAVLEANAGISDLAFTTIEDLPPNRRLRHQAVAW